MSSQDNDRAVPTALAEACAARVKRLRAALSAEGLDGLLVSYPVEIRYLTGFSGDDSLLIVDHEAVRILTDPRYDEYLDPWRPLAGVEVEMGVRHRLEESVAACCRDRGLTRLAVQADRMTVGQRAKLAGHVGDERLVDTTDIVATLRMRKDEIEVAAIERSIGIHEAALLAALPELRIGMTELEFCARLEYEMKCRGAAGPSFGTMVCTGSNSSVIHHTTGSREIEPGVLLVDWGAYAGGYCSDMTRTFGVGDMPPPIREIYAIVLEAQVAAIDACAPGRTCADIDAVARDIITSAGHGEHFGHGLGHGLGLEIHESPYFNDLETETRLEPGMVMTVEPGIYLPGVGGVRIEDDVLITEDGARVLTTMPKDADWATIAPGTGSASPAGVG